ncbi:hypothetical protein BT96DRAFT_1027853 [Gymnopus androsaceus JB14]|uniref:Rad9-domain-containing protein n=1 Tax=Gymnopus androsaceus JB14 TaxID=1447944 RepID=A0A6A4IN26_9AGAR|nr:hypothetical protein BT96DRAFT_1027853 [Gymnopus androsaceus JB14]
MQATFDAHALKSFTRALACLSRYGEELCIYSGPEVLTLFCTNSSKSAYCRFKFNKEFFSKYRAGDPAKGTDDSVVGQLMAKPLLSILKHKTVESTLERCEISIIEGVADEEAPMKLRTAQNLIPQLIWTFGETEVEVKSLESSIDTRSKAQLATELTISAEEFDVYNLFEAPTTITFHLREFNATIAFAESGGLGLDIRFTDPSEPLFIDLEGDSFETLFVISTSQPPGSSTQPRPASTAPKKRLREDTPGNTTRFKKPAKVVHSTTDRASVALDTPSRNTPYASRQMLPPATPVTPSKTLKEERPLFLPSSSQLSILNEKELQESGLGIEHMSAEEFNDMFEVEGEELIHEEVPSQTMDDEPMLDPTQREGVSFDDQSRSCVFADID